MENQYRTILDPLPTNDPTRGVNLGYTPAPQAQPQQIADWAKPYYQSTNTANSTTPYLSESDRAFANSGYQQAADSVVPTEDSAYANQLKMRQREIDAANATYTDLLNKTRQENLNRTGSSGARQAKAGLLGSDFGAAIDASTSSFNQDQVLGVEAQRQSALASIYGTAKSDAAKEVALKQAAKLAGYDAVKENIAGKLARAQAAISAQAQTIANSGQVLDDKLASDLASQYGVDKSIITSAYLTAKQAADKAKLEATKTQGEIDLQKANITKGNMFELSEGQAQYYRDPVTGEVKQLAKVGKTYAPKAVGTGGVGGGTSGGGQYKTDLDAIIGATLSTIPSRFGQSTFQTQISRARNDGDKISLVASQVLKGAPAADRTDFTNQAVGIKQLDKAIATIDSKAKTGFLNNAKQYTFNIFGKDYDPQLAEINSYITAAIQPYRNSVTGAAWGEQEDAEYASLFGSTKYSPTELRERLVRVKEIMKDKSVTALNSYVNPMSTYENPFIQGVASAGQNNVQNSAPKAVDLSEFGL